MTESAERADGRRRPRTAKVRLAISEGQKRRALAANERAWDERMATPLVIDDDSIDPDRYEVEQGAEVVGDTVLWAEEE